jgi:hypothetical protein
MRPSPRTRRLRTDWKALERLKGDSTILDFQASGDPPECYLVRFVGRGLWKCGDGEVAIREHHEVSIRLGASYPRMMPDLAWRTPIFHPNISVGGVVCLGGYGAHWAPSLNLDGLCEMLWDMIRYANFDVESAYNREAAAWAKAQRGRRFPLDQRPIRDKLAGCPRGRSGKPPVKAPPAAPRVSRRLDGEVVDAELVDARDSDILFIQ